MKVHFYAWKPRDRPPLFNGFPTWNFVKCVEIENPSEEDIKQILAEIAETVNATRFKATVFHGREYSAKHYQLEDVENGY